MNFIESIPKNQDLLSSQDYEFLREEGMKYIEQLAHKLWTDYNVHDPGITMLEAICFAITDLGYRTNFDIKDILEPLQGEENPPNSIFTARKILTNAPQSLLDFRKLLVDVDGVKNAWLEVAERGLVDFYPDCKDSSLKYYDPNEIIKPKDLKLNSESNNLLVKWLDSDTISGSEEIYFAHKLAYSADDGTGNLITRERLISVHLPGWISIAASIFQYLPFINHNFNGESGFVTIIRRDFDQGSQTWTGALRIEYTNDEGPQVFNFNEVKVKGIAEESQRVALETWLVQGELIAWYRDHLHRELLKLIYPPIDLMGLNKVLLELDEDDDFGDLNSRILEYSLTYKDSNILVSRDLDILFPAWTDLFIDLEFYYDFLTASGIKEVQVSNVYFDYEDFFMELDITLTYDADGGEEILEFQKIRVNGLETQSDIDEFLVQILSIGDSSISGNYHLKMKRVLEVYENARACLHQNRPLCEDWLEISGVGVNDVAVCADIDLQADAEIEKVLASLTYEIENYFSPSIQFYTLKEMTDKGHSTDDIFQGPALEHGFIEDEELENADLKTHLYTSDIINILMDIEGVKSVRNVLLTRYDELGNPVLPSAQWCLELEDEHKALLDWNHSKFLFFKDSLPFKLDESKYEKFRFYYNQLKAIGDSGKLLTDDLDYEIPVGQPADLEAYSPLRNVFPQTYGVGPAGLSDQASKERKAKAEQLKAFLLFFDQQLANYFSQLKNVKALFSLTEYSVPEEKTYFHQYLSEAQIGGSLYTDALKLQQQLHRLTESEDVYLDRRNRFLDHLLSRFAEDFTDYTLLMHSLDGQKAPRELIHDKISFLKEYDVVSKERGKGFDYTNEAEIWDTGNVSGLEKRISRKLGIESYDRRNLHCPTICDRYSVIRINNGPGNPPSFRFRLNDKDLLVFDGLQLYDDSDDAIEAAEEFLDLATNPENYKVADIAGEFFVTVYDTITGTNYASTRIALGSADFADRFIEAFSYRIRLDFEVEIRKYFIFKNQSGKKIFQLKDDSGVLLQGLEKFDTDLEVYTAMEEFLTLAANPENYLPEPKPNGKFTLAVVRSNTKVARFSGQIDAPSLAEALVSWPDEFQFIGYDCLETEGMHLVEHILLRPRREYLDPFAEVCLEKDCKLCGQEDPYSFRASVILPYWSRRFTDDDLAFREYVERQIRLETPAHVHLKICWVSNKMMRRFELWYRLWLEANAERFHDPVLWSFRLRKLLEAWGELRSVYPSASLHNCENDQLQNSVILNKTVLGSFNPPEESSPENE